MINTTATPKFIAGKVQSGTWREETVPAATVGLSRDVTVYRARRKTTLIKHDYHGDADTFCPPIWWDMAIGSGACGLLCRACFLMLTFRSMRDPRRPVIYDNVEDFWKATAAWLKHPTRKRQHTLGLGIDCSDSLLYEGITGHARNLIPLFADVTSNPLGNCLVLLTKSINTHYLADLPTDNVAVTFSLNPEPIADLWEGKWDDSEERVTPSIHSRLEACLEAQKMGFETRWRVDPILYPHGWEYMYGEFFATAAEMGLRPRYITLGTYREKDPNLDLWREWWGLREMEWNADEMAKEGTHRHVPESKRLEIYSEVRDQVRRYLPHSRISLCKETHSVRKKLQLCNADCNCLR
jgi:DNA repair photolyase